MYVIMRSTDLVESKRNQSINDVAITDLRYGTYQASVHADIVLFQDDSGNIKILKNRVTFEELVSLIESIRNLIFAVNEEQKKEDYSD